MVFVRDEGSFFDAPIDLVWQLVSSGDGHSAAHHHQRYSRARLPGNRGEYSWEQDFDGRPTRFTMRWASYHPFGLAYEVLEGPFEGSRFFLYYAPDGARTAVTIVGDFVSPTLREADIPAAVRRFFDVEFAQDSAALEELRRRSASAGPT